MGRGPFLGNQIDVAPTRQAQRGDAIRLINTDQHHRCCRPVLPQQTHVAQQQRLNSDHRRQGEHLIEQLGVGNGHHDGGPAERTRVHVGSVWTSDADVSLASKFVDDASSEPSVVDKAPATADRSTPLSRSEDPNLILI